MDIAIRRHLSSRCAPAGDEAVRAASDSAGVEARSEGGLELSGA